MATVSLGNVGQATDVVLYVLLLVALPLLSAAVLGVGWLARRTRRRRTLP